MPTALIIGASRGIGHALAHHYQNQGWRVVVTARQPDDLAALVEQGFQGYLLDVNNLNDCASLGWRLDDEKIDVAVINAGVIGPRTPGLNTPSQEDFDQVMHTNVLAAMRLAPIIVPLVSERKGKFAVISSRMGSLSLRDNAHNWLYRASKAALNSVLLDISLVHPDVTSIALHPGWVRTEMGGNEASLTPQESAAGLYETIAARSNADNGKFYNYDGSLLSW